MFHGHEYSIYSDSPSVRTGVYAWLAITAASVSALAQHLIAMGAQAFHITGSSFNNSLVVAAAPLALFWLFAWQFDQWVWRTWMGKVIFSLARAKRPPIVDGWYAGTSSGPEPVEGDERKYAVRQVRVRIMQRWEKIGVAFEFAEPDEVVRSRSHSDMAFIENSFDDSRVRLQYTYSYESTMTRPGGAGVRKATVRGACSLNFVRKDGRWRAVGHYFDDIGTSGEVDLIEMPTDRHPVHTQGDATQVGTAKPTPAGGPVGVNGGEVYPEGEPRVDSFGRSG